MTVECYHCGLPVESTGGEFDAVIGDKQRSFCCHGCRHVCETIHAAGLGSFYRKTPVETTFQPPPEIPESLSAYDIDEVQVDYVDTLAQNRTMHLLVEGIHCAACVWLIETALQREQGVLAADVNLTGKKLRLRWDNQQTQLSRILQRLADLGYVAVPFDPETAEGALAKRHRAMVYRMAFAGFAMMNILWVSIALYAGAADDEFRNWFHWIGFALATPTLFYSGYPFLRNAITGLKNWQMTMDLPIAIGATATYLYSSYITFTGSTQGEVYFDTVVNFLFVILVGRYLETLSKRNALSATRRLLELQPKLANVVTEKGIEIRPIRSVMIGDRVQVRPGAKIPVDGQVITGNSAVDEAMLTGESVPVAKHDGDSVIAGSLNTEGTLQIEATAVLRNTALARILDLMDEAQSSKAPIQSLTDRIVPWFVLVTLTLATLTFVYWLQHDFEIALLAASSVLVVTCPCAFGMATPMSIAVASGVGAQNGVLIKQGAALERLSAVTHYVFDKTGTLTVGEPAVVRLQTADAVSEDQLLKLAASAEQHSEHTLGRAIVETAERRHLSLSEASDFQASPGRGIQARVDEHDMLIGHSDWIQTQLSSMPAKWETAVTEFEEAGLTAVLVVSDGEVIGMLGLQDRLRDDTNDVIRNLQQDGYNVSVLSGDRPAVVQAITVGLDPIGRYAGVLPADKRAFIENLQRQGDVVAMIGDGINDSPALIQADTGIALASGTDVSIESADIVLSHNRLSQVLIAGRMARRTLRTIRQNIVLSITYNIIMVPLAMMAMVSPLMAAVTMPISSLLVIGNSARIGRMFRRS